MGGIKTWAEDDKPREKFTTKGKASLSNSELIAILIRTGSSDDNAIEVGRSILSLVNDDLNKLAKLSIKDLTSIPGVGPVKAITILAALELGGRREASEVRDRAKIGSSKDAYHYIKWRLEDLDYEEFWIILLDRSNKVIGEYRISEGGVAGTVVDPKRIFKKALDVQASGLILIHNHPSGNLKPSQQDISITSKLKQGGLLLDIGIFDHLIIGHKSFFSFADEGLL